MEDDDDKGLLFFLSFIFSEFMAHFSIIWCKFGKIRFFSSHALEVNNLFQNDTNGCCYFGKAWTDMRGKVWPLFKQDNGWYHSIYVVGNNAGPFPFGAFYLLLTLGTIFNASIWFEVMVSTFFLADIFWLWLQLAYLLY